MPKKNRALREIDPFLISYHIIIIYPGVRIIIYLPYVIPYTSISTTCKFEQFMRMRYALCYIERSGNESYGDTRAKSGKATAITF